MRYRFLGSITAFLAGAGLAVAQSGAGSKPVESGPPAAVLGGSLPPPVWSKPDKAACDTCIPDNCCEPTSRCEDRVWMSANYMFIWIKPGPAPALVTTGAEGNPPGALGQPDTRILYPDPDIGFKGFHGGRITIGCAIDDFKTKAIEVSAFGLGSREDVFQLRSDDTGFPVIARPFFNVLQDTQGAQFVSFPEAFAGGTRVSSNADVYGGEINLACNLVDVGPLAVDGLVGARFFYLGEELDIRDVTTSLSDLGTLFFQGAALDEGAALTVSDNFETFNYFSGGQVGLRGEYHCDCWYVQCKAKVALGYSHGVVKIKGSTSAIEPDGDTFATDQGGLLALPTNIGEHSKGTFAVMPEIEVNIGINLTERIRVYAGYSFLYLSSVLRPGEQIDFGIDTTVVPSSVDFGTGVGTPTRPRVLLERADFWMHGINAGFAYHW